MKKLYLFYFYILVCVYAGEAQDASATWDHVAEPRLKLEDDLNALERNSEMAYTVSSKDTFYVERGKPFDMSYFKTIMRTNPDLIGYYMKSAFYFTASNSSYNYRSRQWMVPVKIYFDKDIPRNIKKEVEKFYKNIEDVPNFSISFTNDIDKANYQIKLTNAIMIDEAERYGITDEFKARRLFFNGCNYTVISDGSKNIMGCTLKINKKELEDPSILLSKIKQGLFLSFGRFFMINGIQLNESFLSATYENQDTLSLVDLEILKMHYSQIFDESIDASEFIQLLHH